MRTVSRRGVLVGGAAALPALGFWAAVQAQQTGQPPAAGQPGTARPGAALAVHPDTLLAACLLIDGRKQIENCQWALRRAKREGVQAFARAEIEEHETVKARLRDLKYQYPTAAQPAPGGQPAAPGGQPAGRTLSVGRAIIPADAAEMVRVEHEVADQCIKNTQQELGKKEGLKFDKMFVAHQLITHMNLLDKAQVFRRNASAELRPVLDEALPIIEKHLATLKGLNEQLDDARPGEKS